MPRNDRTDYEELLLRPVGLTYPPYKNRLFSRRRLTLFATILSVLWYDLWYLGVRAWYFAKEWIC